MGIILIFVVYGLEIILLILGLKIASKSFSLARIENLNFIPLVLFGLGILIFTLGEVIEEVLFEFTLQNIDRIHLIKGIFSILGFLLITLSILKTRT